MNGNECISLTYCYFSTVIYVGRPPLAVIFNEYTQRGMTKSTDIMVNNLWVRGMHSFRFFANHSSQFKYLVLLFACAIYSTSSYITSNIEIIHSISYDLWIIKWKKIIIPSIINTCDGLHFHIAIYNLWIGSYVLFCICISVSMQMCARVCVCWCVMASFNDCIQPQDTRIPITTTVIIYHFVFFSRYFPLLLVLFIFRSGCFSNNCIM